MTTINAKRLAECRKARLLTVSELACRAGMSPATLRNLEKGAPATMRTMRKVLDALEMTADAAVSEGVLAKEGENGT